MVLVLALVCVSLLIPTCVARQKITQPQIGLELETPDGLLHHPGIPPPAWKALKGAKIEGHSGKRYDLTLETTEENEEVMRFEYITKDIPLNDPSALASTMKQIFKDQVRSSTDPPASRGAQIHSAAFVPSLSYSILIPVHTPGKITREKEIPSRRHRISRLDFGFPPRGQAAVRPRRGLGHRGVPRPLEMGYASHGAINV